MGKVFGIIGGLGAHASSLLYQKIIDSVDAKTDGDYCQVLLNNISIDGFGLSAMLNNDGSKKLLNEANKMSLYGCDYVYVACGSVHRHFKKWSNDKTINWFEDFIKDKKDTVILASESTEEWLMGKEMCGINASKKTLRESLNICIDEVICGRHKKTLTAKNRWDFLMKEISGNEITLACTELSVLFDMYGSGSSKCNDAIAYIVKDLKEKNETYSRK